MIILDLQRMIRHEVKRSTKRISSLPHSRMVDRSLFTKSEIVKAIRVPVTAIGELLKESSVRDCMFIRRGRKSILCCPREPNSHRLILFKDSPAAEILSRDYVKPVDYELSTTYDDFNAEEVLRKLIDIEQDPPSSFETIGHIAHMNLRDEFIQYKNLIGEVILDKNPHIRTVVTKVGVLSNEFRTFPMEIIASRDDDESLIANVNERRMKLRIDYRNCYWNSRLATERERLMQCFTSTLPDNSRLIDMCCGIGALACFASREGLEVFGNDLNPSAIECARYNSLQNKVDVPFSNKDARDFLRGLVRDGKLKEGKVNHVMINLPEIGIEFLDVFEGLFSSLEELGENEFRIYCHVFSREKPPTDISDRIPLRLPHGFDVRNVHVRDVAPSKIMYSSEFTVPRDILIANPVKRSRLD